MQSDANEITTWPCPTWTGHISAHYGERINGQMHSVIDIDGDGHEDAVIVAVGTGTVLLSGSNSSYGKYAMIDHGNGYTTIYAHMSDSAVSQGQSVIAGQTIGYMGSTGNASSTCCHFEIRVNGASVDPEGWFSGEE